MDQKPGKEIPHHIKKIRLDNSGENRMLQAKADQENLAIKFEFTAPGTPQQSSVVERKFPTIMGRGRAIMNHAGLDDNFRNLPSIFHGTCEAE